MPKIVISNTNSLILFHKIDEFSLLQKVLGDLITTPEIAEEFGETLPDWIKVQPVLDRKYQIFLETQIDIGEANAIAWASVYKNILLLLADLKARKLAKQLKFTGSLGVIHQAKQLSIIDKVKPLID